MSKPIAVPFSGTRAGKPPVPHRQLSESDPSNDNRLAEQKELQKAIRSWQER